MTTFYRFQGRETLDTHSYCEFLVDIWFELGGANKECSWGNLDEEIQLDLLEELNDKWDIIADIWVETYQHQFPLLINLSDLEPMEALIQLVDTYSDLGEVVELQHKFPLPGVFGIQVAGQNKQELFEISKRQELGLHNNYLLTLESEDWIDLKEYGFLLFDARRISVESVPNDYHKPSFKG